jgi:hypothetical protein
MPPDCDSCNMYHRCLLALVFMVPCSFVLFMLPRLTSLDTLLLAEETKQLAEATYLKKQVHRSRCLAGVSASIVGSTSTPSGVFPCLLQCCLVTWPVTMT